MKMTFKNILTFSLLSLIATASQAQTNTVTVNPLEIQSSTMMDELDPRDPNIAEILKKMDANYEEATGYKAIMEAGTAPTFFARCYRMSCPLYVRIYMYESPQYMEVFVNGESRHKWKVSTGGRNHETIEWDDKPQTPFRIYNSYTSRAYPAGDYQGMGNMPYAMFFYEGYAIHGTTQGSIPYLGQPASHGCVRLHPDNAYVLNQYARKYGASGTWIRIR